MRERRHAIAPDDSPPLLLPRNFLRPCVLLLLAGGPAHGYELHERLRPLGFTRDDPGRLYRALRALEQDGHVRSVWEKSSSGPDRRTYELTRSGSEQLREAARALEQTRTTLDAFLARFRAVAGGEPARRPRSRRAG